MTIEEKIKWLKLTDAIKLYRNEERAISNSYEWFRKSALRHGTVDIGETNVPAEKRKGTWYVDNEKFVEAIKKHREAIRHLKQVTADHVKGILHGKEGEMIQTEWGGYGIQGEFRFEWSDHKRIRMESDGTWYCNKCNAPAETEHNKEECHLCSDWNSCGRDCTLGRVFCSKCNTSLNP